MPLASDRQVNEKPFEIGMNSQKSAGFDPLSWEKTEKIVLYFELPTDCRLNLPHAGQFFLRCTRFTAVSHGILLGTSPNGFLIRLAPEPGLGVRRKRSACFVQAKAASLLTRAKLYGSVRSLLFAASVDL